MISGMSKKISLTAALGLAVGAGLIVRHGLREKDISRPVQVAQRQIKIPTEGVKKVSLPNGMNLLMYKTDIQPKVHVQLAYDVGSYIEQDGERGLAHLLEHMIFKGTQKLSESDLVEIARKYGASYNAFTAADVTSYYFEIDKNNWQPFIAILADCMQNARFDQQHLNSELKAVIQELRMNKDKHSRLMVGKAFAELFPANHPYHHPIIGYKDDLMNISAERVKAFYQKYYQPNRATLFVVGDISYNEVEALVRQQFEAIPSMHPPIVRDFPRVPAATGSCSLRFYEAVKNEELGFFWRVPGLKSGQDVVALAAASVLCSGEGCRLQRALVDEYKVASAVGGSCIVQMEGGIFLIIVHPLPGKVDQCRAIVKSELDKAIKDGFTEQELASMAIAQTKGMLHNFQDFQSLTWDWMTSVFAGHDEFEVFKKPEQFARVTSREVQDFIEKNLSPLVMNEIEILPIPQGLIEAERVAKMEDEALDRKILTKYERTVPLEAPRYALQMPSPQPIDFSFPKPDRQFVLNNGLTVLLHKQKALPLLAVNCSLREADYFAAAREGTALGFAMDMLIEGSEGFSKRELVDFFERYGVDYNFDVGGASLSMLNVDVEPILSRFIHILLKPAFPAEAFEKLRAAALDGLKRSLDRPMAIASDLMKRTLYAHSPDFGYSIEDAIKDLEQLDLSQVHRIYNTLVMPNNLVLSIAGDMDLDLMQKLIERLFSSWPAGAAIKVEYPDPFLNEARRIDYEINRDQAVLMLVKPSEINLFHEDYIAMRLLNTIAFDSLGSRLFQIREQTGLFYTATGGWAVGAGQAKGKDSILALVNPDNLDRAEQEIRAMIVRMAKDGVTVDELAGARQAYMKWLIDVVSSNESVASRQAMLFSRKLGFDYYDRMIQRAQTITLDEVNRVCAKYFTTDGMARIRVGRVGK